MANDPSELTLPVCLKQGPGTDLVDGSFSCSPNRAALLVAFP